MVPMHFMTHELLLFFTGLWTTNIHDCLHVGIMPIMGAGYHTIHHTTYKHNYGHYTIYFDYLYGTLTHPEDFEGIKKLEEKARRQRERDMMRAECACDETRLQLGPAVGPLCFSAPVMLVSACSVRSGVCLRNHCL